MHLIITVEQGQVHQASTNCKGIQLRYRIMHDKAYKVHVMDLTRRYLYVPFFDNDASLCCHIAKLTTIRCVTVMSDDAHRGTLYTMLTTSNMQRQLHINNKYNLEPLF